MTIRTIHFEDDGQDFLEWDIDEEGKVIDCRPFQASIWIGSKVMLKTLRAGRKLVFQAKPGIKVAGLLRHRVARIETKEAVAEPVVCLQDHTEVA